MLGCRSGTKVYPFSTSSRPCVNIPKNQDPLCFDAGNLPLHPLSENITTWFGHNNFVSVTGVTKGKSHRFRVSYAHDETTKPCYRHTKL